MKVRNPNMFTKWRFYFKDLQGQVLSFPQSGEYASGLHALYQDVAAQFEIFDKDTNGEYTKILREEANKVDKTYEEWLKVIIEHQICTRHHTLTNKLCWEDGLGDKLHSVSMRIDNVIEKFPTRTKKAAQTLVKAVTKAATGKANPKMGTCQVCGGTTEFDPSKHNLGRAGALNNLVPTFVKKERN